MAGKLTRTLGIAKPPGRYRMNKTSATNTP